MRKWLSILVLGLAASVPLGDAGNLGTTAQAAPLKNRIGLTYSLLLDQDGSLVTTSLLDGLQSGDSFRLKIKPGQDCYAYLVVQRDPDDFRLLYPTGRFQRGKNMLRRKKEFVWPQDGWLRLDQRAGTERIFLILSAERIYELEARFAFADKAFTESVLLDIRDRYQNENNSYNRVIGDERVRVRFRSEGLPAVLIEEIALRHM